MPKPRRGVIWAWCLAWLFFIWSTLYLMDANFRPQIGKLHERLNSLGSPSPLSTEVLALGNSLMGDSIPTEILLQTNSGPIHLKRLSLAASRWQDFHTIRNEILVKEYDLILFQDNLLLEIVHFPLPARVRLYAGQLLRSFIRNGKAEITTDLKKLAPTPKEGRAAHLESTYAKNTPVSKQALEFLAELSRQHKKVVVVHLPRAESLESGPNQLKWRLTLENQLEQLGIQYESLGNSLPDNYYKDASHPNDLGRTIRTTQFSELVQDHLP